MTMDHVSYTVTDQVAMVTLNRPESLNAFTDLMERQLIDCFDRADADDNVRVVVITGAGGAFCSGMDLSESEPDSVFKDWRSSPNAPEGTQFPILGDDLPLRRDGGGRVALRIFDSLKPVIAAINGHAVGVGITLTLAADIRIAADSAKVGFPFARRGFVPESCSSWFLPRIVPMQQALEWMLTGRIFSAQEGLDGGLFRSLHPADQVLQAALGLAHEIAAHTSPVSVSMSRRMLWQMMGASHPMVAHEIETHALNLRGVSADAQEGVGAFVEKRPPVFSDAVSTDIPGVFYSLPTPSYRPPRKESS